MTISRLIAIIFFGLACLLSLPGCQQATPPAPDSGAAAAPPATTIQLATAELKLVERRVRIPFTLEGYQQIDVTSRIDGHLLAVHFDIGDKVVTYDFARLMDGATEVKCSEFAQALVDRL